MQVRTLTPHLMPRAARFELSLLGCRSVCRGLVCAVDLHRLDPSRSACSGNVAIRHVVSDQLVTTQKGSWGTPDRRCGSRSDPRHLALLPCRLPLPYSATRGI